MSNVGVHLGCLGTGISVAGLAALPTFGLDLPVAISLGVAAFAVCEWLPDANDASEDAMAILTCRERANEVYTDCDNSGLGDDYVVER